ncbi:MAG: TRAP transporter large permease [Roseitalea sp.]|jgi:tripartite ATP-independent transporter DctM subunit|uniref:TRAP transporter large permease n=1 Tax=Oceaniradius stylonematis TaxID=2184161 RepID=UPI001B030BF8|nr:TRAP transporter large permease [Oceaniradius stylonematis]MBO6552053.1 TRAP transporter large permease [Roseitalea sp.]MBO6951567.1 TRAP transporter large permease [Rhizobiaceae bacterium]MBO6592587.1 TRAP transporter large permease [Roseitalea sp.]MBO6598842.1 TRAP transporter large permease [Roseitalea sp.]MBO6611288.1 TRAP transporter large permease [Roseitalea sp.]
MTISLLGFAAVIVLAFLRVPIAFAMGLVGVVGFGWLNDWKWTAALSPAAGTVLDSVQTETLSVLPLFILMGLLVSQAGLASELYRASNAFLGHRRGGLAMATVIACGGFSAISGSSLATAATMSKVAMPEMRRYGYDDQLATASIAAGGTLGILIPPSVILIIYGVMTEQSIEKLFLAGVIPGLVGILLYLAAVRFIVWRRPHFGPSGARSDWHARAAAVRNVWPIVLLFTAVLGGIYLGIYTTTEAAGIGAAGALVIALVRRKLGGRALLDALIETLQTTASLFAVLIGAVIFQRFVVRAGLPEALLEVVTALDVGPLAVIFMILLVYFLLGCVFESLSMMLLTVPVFAPVVAGLGLFSEYGAMGEELSLIWFGIFVVVATEISLITPPVGLNVYVLKGVIGDVATGTIFRGITPFWAVDIVRLVLLVFIPYMAIALPLTMQN